MWISVKDKLPEITHEFGGSDGKMYGSSATVLAFSGCVDVAEYHKSQTWSTSKGSKLSGVTHWMPLPEPPTSAAD